MLNDVTRRQRRRARIRSFLLIMGLIFAPLPGAVSFGQESSESAAVPAELGPEAMQSLVSKLNAEQTEALVQLVELLDRSAENDGGNNTDDKPAIGAAIKTWLTGFGASMKANAKAFPDTVVDVGRGIASIFSERTLSASFLFLLLVAASILAGFIAEWVFNRITGKYREAIRQAAPDTLLETLKTLSARAGIEIGGVIVFAVVAQVVVNLIITDSRDHLLASVFIFNVIVLVRLFAAILHFVLAPRRPELRLVHTDTWTAQFIERQFILLAIFVGIGFFLTAVLREQNPAATGPLRFWMGLFFHLWIIFVTLKARAGLTSMIKGDDEQLTPGLAAGGFVVARCVRRRRGLQLALFAVHSQHRPS